MDDKELWDISVDDSVKFNNPVFIEGLPGIGNVGKVVVDFLIEKSKAKSIASFFSYTLPNSVFVGEDNLVQLPKIEVFHAKINNKDFLFMTGDVQPSDEVASYIFCQKTIEMLKSWNTKNIVTLGGIGLHEVPLDPEVFCTGNDKSFVESFVKKGANKEVYGVVGPIIGVSGLLLGLTRSENIPSVALLAETFGHPMYLGLRGAKAVLMLFKEMYGIDYSFKDLEDEILELESDGELVDSKKNPKIDTINRLKKFKDMSYIG